MVKRLLVPRPVRRAMHPVRTTRRAITPRPIRRATRAAFVLTNPFEAVEGVFEDAVVSALRPSRGRRRQPAARRPSGQSFSAREARYLQAVEAEEVLQAALTLHRLQMQPAAAPSAPEPLPVSPGRIRGVLRRNARRGVPWYRREQRRRCRATADQQLEQVIADEIGRRQALRDEQQQRIDRTLAALLANAPATVRSAAMTALHPLPLDVLLVDVQGTSADLIVVYHPLDNVVPEHAPAVTPTGLPSTRGRSQTERNDLYADALAAAALASVNTVASACPGLERFRVAIAERETATVVLAAEVARPSVAAGEAHSGLETLEAAGELLLTRKGRSRTITPLPETGFVAEITTAASQIDPEATPEPLFDRAALLYEQQEEANNFAAGLPQITVDVPAD